MKMMKKKMEKEKKEKDEEEEMCMIYLPAGWGSGGNWGHWCAKCTPMKGWLLEHCITLYKVDYQQLHNDISHVSQ